MSRIILIKREWSQRFSRLIMRSNIALSDIRRSASWYLGGGSRYFQRYSPELLKAHKWCFIVGCNNSGTSLLQGLLEKSNVVTTLQHEGQRYTRELPRANRKGYERVWSEYLESLRLTEETTNVCAPRVLHDLMSEYECPIRTIIVEKTTANAVRMRWLQKVFPNSCFIGLVRNGYAVTEGICRKGNKDVYRAARHWNLVNKFMMQDSRKVKNFLEVRYEDLTDHYLDTSTRIASFLGIDVDSFKGVQNAEFEFTTIKGSGRMPIRNLNGDCIKRLSMDSICEIGAEASEMLDYFGYTPPVSTEFEAK